MPLLLPRKKTVNQTDEEQANSSLVILKSVQTRKYEEKNVNNSEMISAYLHELKGEFKVLHWVHFDAEELEAHDEADGGLDDVGALLLLPQLL